MFSSRELIVITTILLLMTLIVSLGIGNEDDNDEYKSDPD